MYWLGKAQLGQALAADPNNPNLRTQLFTTATNSLRAAADRANQLGAQDPDAKARRPEMLLDLADERGARAIVIGTYGESPLRGAVLGSTPHKLLHLSKVPVLAVPA